MTAEFKRHVNISDEEIQKNIINSLRYPQFQPGGKEGAVVICAAGPSLLSTLPLIQALYNIGVPICAVKGTADVLLKHGVTPTYVVSMDGKEDQVRFFTKPHSDIEYLIAGQSHPKVFEALDNCRVTVWHGEGKQHLPPGTHYILGGSTSGFRAVTLMWAKGYQVHHLFGFDCCELNGETHVYEVVNEKKLIDVYLGDLHFRATGQMIYQYQEFFHLFQGDLPIDIVAHGEGMLAKAWALASINALPSLTTSPIRR